ncbi:hypothetical protein ACQ7B2_12955, partial [Escherichia coli]
VVHQKNQRTYGASLTNDFGAGEFARAYANWSRVRGVPLRKLVPVDRAQREATYPYSEAARKLEPILENPSNGWATWGCATLSI